MSLHIKQDNSKTELQQKIAAELRIKTSQNSLAQAEGDFNHQADYLKNTKPTTSLAFVWLLLFVALAICIGYIFAFA